MVSEIISIYKRYAVENSIYSTYSSLYIKYIYAVENGNGSIDGLSEMVSEIISIYKRYAVENGIYKIYDVENSIYSTYSSLYIKYIYAVENGNGSTDVCSRSHFIYEVCSRSHYYTTYIDCVDCTSLL